VPEVKNILQGMDEKDFVAPDPKCGIWATGDERMIQCRLAIRPTA
jgi:hypothetical protein